MTTVNPALIGRLRSAAGEAQPQNYTPYSEFQVLAAVETTGGEIYGGSNVEIANYSLTKHAEEVAVVAAIVGGAGPGGKWIQTLYVVGGAPCGSCRQFVYEFAAPSALCIIESVHQSDLRSGIWLDRPHPELQTHLIRELLPQAFGQEDL